MTRPEKSLDSIINIRKRFRDAVVDVLTSSVAEKGGNNAKINPIALREASEAARKDTILTMDELSNLILTGTAGPFRATDPGDILPPMPLRPVRPPQPPGADLNSSQASLGRPPAGSASPSQTTLNPQTGQTSFGNPVQGRGSASSSQTSLEVLFAPSPQRNNIYSPASGWKMPKFEDTVDSSTSLVRATSSSRSALNWMFPPKPIRPYYDIPPLEPTPPVVPSFKCNEDPSDVLQDGEAAVQRLWAVANNTIVEERPGLYPHSAPLLQGPWASIWEDEPEPRPRTPLLYEREASPTPEATSPSLLLSPARLGNRPASAQAGKRVRSEPMLEFSTPASRFRRHVSGPSDARGG
jgi:hypothetical protein